MPEWISVLHAVALHGSPFVAFFVGVYISTKLKLETERTRVQVWWVSVPVGLFAVGTLLKANAVTDVQITPGGVVTQTQYGFAQDWSSFLIFMATLMFYGTLSNQLFNRIRGQHVSSKPDNR